MIQCRYPHAWTHWGIAGGYPSLGSIHTAHMDADFVVHLLQLALQKEKMQGCLMTLEQICWQLVLCMAVEQPENGSMPEMVVPGKCMHLQALD